MSLVPPKLSNTEEKSKQKSIGLPKWMWEVLELEKASSNRHLNEVIRLLLEKAGVKRELLAAAGKATEGESPRPPAASGRQRPRPKGGREG